MRELNRVHLNGLRAVEAAARCRSLQAAAEELGVSPSAVSQQINRTESQLGRRLFERTPAGLIPTEFGALFTARLTSGFRELADALALVEAKATNTLVLSVAPAFASRWLVPRLSRFHARFPEIRLRIDASKQLADLDRSDIDVAIRLGDGAWPNAKAELLLAQEIFPVCSPELAERLSSAADLCGVPVIGDENTMITWDRWFGRAAVKRMEFAPGPTFTDPILGLEAAIAGQGVMLAWQLIAADALLDGRLVAPFGITAESGLAYYLVTSSRRKPARKVLDFKNWVGEEIRCTVGAVEAVRRQAVA
jgi:LysR family transcriptional regulator, glycine cleavage system transcriptional activator